MHRLTPLLACLALAPVCAQDETPAPRRAVILIADGMGPAAVNLARQARGRLRLDDWLVGMASTRAADNVVTDSAASATAMACGVKTNNGRVSVGPDGARLPTVLEAAEARGLATGIVVTCRLTHATPACFSAHVENRGMEAAIAAQQLEQGIEVLLGGGRRWFLPREAGGSRRDGRDLLGEARERGYTVLDAGAQLEAEVSLPVLGLFTPDHMAYERDRPSGQPSLAAMTRRALDLLASDPEGFLLVVEGSRIDHAAHNNDPIGVLYDTLAFDDAVGVVLDWAAEHGPVTLVATADHETGGLTLGADVPGQLGYGWDLAPVARAKVASEGLYHALQGGTSAEDAARDLLGIESLAPDEREALQAAAEDPRRSAGLLLHAVSRRARLGWSTFGHTGVDVALWAAGPGAERFRGHQPNTVVATGVAAELELSLEPTGAGR